ncbi:TPA: hypothetical protein I6W52_003539 [Vibrio cholerae]|nr:hypothetical protein [Vibrio cholerae]
MISIYVSEDSNLLLKKYNETFTGLLYPESGLHLKKVAEWVENISPKLNPHIFTHFYAIINKLGYMIEEGVLPHEDVKVYVPYEDRIVEANYNSEGYLVNWPIGFFNV